ncbi:cell division control protein 1 [[Candida] jaroonii]|uniref:Cell division control protein 1 n=1 Tax=[Candida] jaroonii TaxID=467808 RepID=A0ACA9YAW7_9ASCO|nr:cell division control protein 1 [[Candida] jaroonii]
MVGVRLKSFHMVIGGILSLWIVTFFIHEKLVPILIAQECHWSGSILPEGVDETKVLFIADPQLIDNHTYPNRNPLLLKLSQHTVDVYIKKNYKALMGHLQPDYVFFLGDYLDNGRSSDDEYFKSQYDRFFDIFQYTKYGFKKNKNYFVSVPGNHDIGVSDGVKRPSRDRFTTYFGKPNDKITIDGVEFITLDTPSLIAKDEGINYNANEFLNNNYKPGKEKLNPRVLMSHIPLFRGADKTCGPLREADFRPSKGYQYQSLVDSDITTDLLERINPDLIFSGDDHDYCDINHSANTREITVKSISMAMGIWYPGVQLLTFSNSDRFVYETKLCLLPTPYVNVVNYIIIAVISGLTVLVWNIKQQRYNYTVLPVSNIKPKNIDDMLNNDKPHPLPNYTFNEKPTWKTKVGNLWKKAQVGSILKQISLLGLVVIFIYKLFIWSI